MKRIKVLLMIVLAVSMLLGMSMTVFADPAHTITISAPATVEWAETTIISAEVTDWDGIDSTAAGFANVWKNGEIAGIGMVINGNMSYSVNDAVIGDVFKIQVQTLNSEMVGCNIVTVTVCGQRKNNEEKSPAHEHKFTWQTITEPTMYSDGLEGEVCSCGATRNTQPLSAYGYAINDYAAKMVNASKSGQTIKLEMGEWNSFPKAFMEKIAAKSAQNVTFVLKYKWNHVKQEITIPAGTAVDTSLDWYGPAKMQELYGAN